MTDKSHIPKASPTSKPSWDGHLARPPLSPGQSSRETGETPVPRTGAGQSPAVPADETRSPADAPSPAAPDVADPPVELEVEAADSATAAGKKLLLTALVVAICVAVIHLTPLKQYVWNDQNWKAECQKLGYWASLAFTGVSAVLISIGIPRLFFGFVAGMLFGFTEGFVCALLGALIGSYATFVFVRWGGREWVAPRIENTRHLRNLLRHPSLFSVFLLRQLPIAGIVPNLVLGITPITHRLFLVGSFLGYLPSTAMIVLIGSGVGKESLSQAIAQITLAMLTLFTVSIVVWYLRKKLVVPAGG